MVISEAPEQIRHWAASVNAGSYSQTHRCTCCTQHSLQEQHAHVLSSFSHSRLFVTLWTIVCQAPLSMGFSRQEYWSGLPFPPPGHLPEPRIEPTPFTSPALAGGFFLTTSTTWEAWKSSLWGKLGPQVCRAPACGPLPCSSTKNLPVFFPEHLHPYV